jgi:general secretion pathway protein C
MYKAARLLAILACAAALGVWGAILLAPRSSGLPPALDAGQAARGAGVAPVALWFGRDQALGTDVVVQGVIAGESRSAAVVSVNGGPPSAVSTNRQAPSGIYIKGIDAQGLTLDMSGAPVRVAPPPRPPPQAGIERR